MNGHIHITFVYQAQAKPQEADQEMQSALDMASVLVDDMFHIYLNAYRARLDLLQERWTAVGAWANSLSLDIENPAINDFTEYSYLTLVRWWLKDNTPETLQQVRFILQPMLEMADETGRNALKAEALLLNAILAQTFGESSLAVEYLINSLRVGDQFRRLYLNEGEAIQGLLKTITTRDDVPIGVLQHVNNLLKDIPLDSSPNNSSSLIEQLTDRELDVLKQLADGHSNRQIAETLFVSVGTVKTHARHIYEKLAVNNRTHAVARAREIGILE